LYKPFYVEDTDISYNAWKRGWTCLLAPASHVVHKHRSSSSRFGHAFVDNTIRRNIFLFIWKNVTDFAMVMEHIVHLPRIHARGMNLYGPAFEMKAYLRALVRLPMAVAKNMRSARNSIVSDREVLARTVQ
jgi:GT2 family glycosyltransferase